MSSSSKDHLSEAGRSARNYGTVTAHVGPGYIEHTVEKTDTLQGIALKYGTTVEVIRRVNKLHSSGMLQLMDYILIPCTDSLLTSGSYRGSPDNFRRISPANLEETVEESTRSIDGILKSADEQLRISQKFAKQLAKKYPQKQPEGYNRTAQLTADDIKTQSVSTHRHSNSLLSRKEEKQRDQREQLENDIFEL